MSRHTDILEFRDYITSLAEKGWRPFSIDDGDGIEVPVTCIVHLEEAVFAVDESHVYFRTTANPSVAWMFIVLGNGPGELVCDYSDRRDGFGDTISEVSDRWAN